MNNTQLQIIPLCLIMVMGPQIITAIFLTTSREVVKNSLAMLVGVALAVCVGLAVWSGIVDAIGIEPSGGGGGPTTADYVVAGLLVLLGIRVWRTRGTAEAPKWMSTLQEAEPKRAFSLGFLLILLMPTDIVAMIGTANHLHDAGLSRVDGWPLLVGTVLLMALPLIGYVAFGERAKRAMPGIRDWLTTHSWLVNLIIIVYFFVQVLT